MAIPDSVQTIDRSVFSGCASLSAVEIPDSVRTIGTNAFYGCASLSSVSIPSFVSRIGNDAFRGIKFLDEDGNVLAHSAADLRGYTYEGQGKVLKRVIDGITLVSDGMVFEIESLSGAYAVLAGFSEPKTALSVPAKVSYDGKDYLVSKIGPKAFYGCEGLVSVDLGGVSTIGTRAFARCGDLESVTASESLTTIGAYAFYGCTSMASLAMPESVASIGKDAFHGITFLGADGEIPHTADALRGHSYEGEAGVLSLVILDGEAFISDGLTYVVASAKERTASVTGFSDAPSDLVIPMTVEYNGFRLDVTGIGPKAFYNCKSLTSVDLGGVSSVGSKAFAGCASLASVTSEGSVVSLEGYAFYNCKSLESADFGSSVKSIGGYAFYNCRLLASVVIGDSVESIGDDAFYGCRALSSDMVLTSAKTIGEAAFDECYSLTSVVIGDSVKSIRGWTFISCRSLTSMVIPDSVKTIGKSAFAGCVSLTFLTIPSSVEEISDQAFGWFKFFDEDGNELSKVASALSGYSYTGDGDGNFFRIAA